MRNLIYALIVVSMGVIAACNTGTGADVITDSSPVVATYEGGTISQAEVEAFLSTLNERQRTRFKTPEGRKDMVERLALNESLAADAVVQGFGTSDQDKIAMRQAADNFLISKLMKDLRDKARGEEQARAHYDESIEDYKKEQAKASHILVKDQAAARKVKGRVDGGEDFAAVAKEVSEDRGSKVKGGDLGWFGRGRMAPEFEEAAFALQEGEISDPIKTKFGYHVIMCTGRRDQIPFEEVQERIHRKLERESITTYMDDRKADLAVSVDEEAISTIEVEDAAAPAAGGIAPTASRSK